jgi:hypothetical protein
MPAHRGNWACPELAAEPSQYPGISMFLSCARRSQSGSIFRCAPIRLFRRLHWGCIFEEARCEVLCENRSENGRGKHQHEDHVEQPAIEQSLTGGIWSTECD